MTFKQLRGALAVDIVLGLFAGLLGFGVGVIAHTAQEPNCPTEDSCTVNYYDHEWHIEEVTP